MPRDYTADARTLVLDHLDDLPDIGPMTMCEVLDADLNDADIDGIGERVKDFAAYLKAAVDAYTPAEVSDAG